MNGKGEGRSGVSHSLPRMRGQALIEFIVLALALVPLLLLIPAIAKYQDIAHAVQLASRYVAFAATTRNEAGSTWKPPAELAQEVHRRFFSNVDAPIKTNDAAGNFKANQNLFWRTHEGEALINNFERDVRVTFGSGDGMNHDAGFSGASDGEPFKGATGVSNSLELAAPGIYRANVHVVLADYSQHGGGYAKTFEYLKGISLKMSRQTSLLLDPWSARNLQHVEGRINQIELFPGKMLAPAAPILNAAVAIVEIPSCLQGHCIPGPKLGELEFWSDVVPADRLK